MRVQTDEDLMTAFELLCRKKDPEKITAMEVAKRAGVTRSTFYNHYENIPALMSAAEDKTIKDIFSIMDSFHPRNDKDICDSYFLWQQYQP